MKRISLDSSSTLRGLAVLIAWLTTIFVVGSALAAPPPPVQLILSTGELAPGTTFEFRFAAPMVGAETVSKTADVPPVTMHPAVKGRFIWLSTRSGTFTPEEPLPLSTTFRFDLRRDLKDAAGQPVAHDFDETVKTPAFALKGWHAPQWFDRSDAPADPRFSLLFNADVAADAAAPFLTFINDTGKKIPARVVPADPAHHPEHYFPRYQSKDRSLLTWAARFSERTTMTLAERPTPQPRANQLFVRPAELLPVGTGWRLIVGEGLPTLGGGLRLLSPVELAIGPVKPFEVRDITAINDGRGGRRVALRFSKALAADLTLATLRQWITITPEPGNLTANVEGRQIELIGDFDLANEYRVNVTPGLPAAEALALPEAHSDVIAFEPIPSSLAFEGFTEHQLSTGTRRFQLQAVNVPRLRVTAKLFQPDTLPHALTAYDGYLNPRRHHGDEWQEKIDPAEIAGTTIYSREIAGTETTDTESTIALEWSDILGAGKTGVVLLTTEQVVVTDGKRAGVQAIVQVTDLGVVWKQSRGETFAHVFSMATGAPRAEVKLRLIAPDHSTLGEAITDPSGVAKLPAAGAARWLLAESGADLHLVNIDDWESRLSLHRFRIDHHDSDEESEGAVSNGRQILLFTERGVYRPGETVHLKGIVRDARAGQPRVPSGTKAQLKAFDDREREIFSRSVTVSAFGSVDASIELPKGTLGTYRATLTFGDEEADDSAVAEHTFEVQEYTPNAFEIAVATPKGLVGAAPLELPVSAHYYMGKALSQAQLSWSLQAEDMSFAPEGFDDFDFCDAIADDRLTRALDRESHFADQGKLELRADGRALVATTVPLNPKAPQPRSATLLCEVTDLNQQTVSQSTELTLHSSDFYLGLGQLPEVVRTGDKLPLALVAVRTDGTPQLEPMPAKLRLTRIDWQNNRVVTDEDSSEYQSEPIFTLLSEREVRTQPVEQREHQWTVAKPEESGLVAGEPGLYLLEALATDASGREVLTSTTFYVSGENTTEWNYRNQFQIELVPDKTEYLSGETARVLVKTPIAGDALVTVERDRVLRSFVTKLSGNAPSVEIPLEGLDAPNVFIGVTLLRGANDSPRKFKEPDYCAGFCALKVTRPESKLSVYVAPERKGYQPGETVNLAVEVRDILGHPRAGAEVTLYAVDEGVLSLTGYNTPDPFTFYNQPLPLTVRTSLTLPTLLREDPEEKSFENKGYLIGGGGDFSAAFRKNFVTCAFWNATLRTDDTGRIATSFIAPDSLTRYRLVAVVQTVDDAFGAGESAFEVSKPLMLEPALPRFANVGDELLLRAVLHNLTDVAGEVDVQLELDATATAESTRRQVSLPARGSLAVDFPVTFKDVGSAQWKWTARFTGADGKTASRDAVQTTLKVGYPVALRREVLLSRTEDSEIDLLAKANPALLEGRGVVRVSLGNSRAIELREALDQVLHYPYGCVEQTTSSTLPWIALKGFRAALPQLTRSEADIRTAVNRGVDRLFSMQTESGALGYWPGAKEPHFWGSAYGGLGLALAKRAGFDVPGEAFDKLLNYLSAQLRGAASDSFDGHYRGGPSDRSLAVYALAIAGRAEPAYHELLFQRRAALSGENRALLALAIAESNGPRAMIEELLRPAKFERTGEEDPFWNTSRETAARLLAWCRFDPQAPATEALSSELLGHRRGGHWFTTQGNSWALLALSEYLTRVEKPQLEVRGALAWPGQRETFELNGTAPVRRVEMPLGASHPALTLANPGKARLYTEVTIESAPRTLSQPRQDQGYGIERSYAKIEDDGTLTELRAPQVGDRVLVTLRLDVRRSARYVAVDDPLPSIFEAVNPVFKSQASRAGEMLGREWVGDFQELRDDRALFFADYLAPGSYTIRYLARVRAAGTATAPSAKIEEMYHPDRFGMTETLQLTSLPLK